MTEQEEFEFRHRLESESSPSSPKVDPTEGMTDWEMRKAGIGKSFYDLARGAGQLVGAVSYQDAKDAREMDAPLVQGRPREVVRKQKVLSSENPNQPARISYQDKGTKFLAGPGAEGVALGNIATSLPLMMAPGANTVLGAGLYGGAYGAMQPGENLGEKIANTGLSAGLSAGVTGAARAIPAAYKALVSPFTQGGQERIALDTIGRFAKDKNALGNASVNELVPGSKPTLAEVTGDPGIAQLQRSAQAASPETANLLAENKTARIQARKDALLQMGDATDKEFFEAAREQTANRLYGKAFAEPIDPKLAREVAPDIKELLARPSIQAAQDEAIRLAKESGTLLKKSDMKGGSVEGLHYMKMSLDDMISAAKRAGNNNEVRILMGTKDKLMGVMQKVSPKYAEALAEFQAGSKPINQIEVTNYLYDKLVPALTDLGAERLTPSAFAKALKEGDSMAQKATGFRGAKLKDILTTDQQTTLVNLGLDLGREAKALEAGKVPGSPTAQYLSGRNALRQMLGPMGLPEGWGEKLVADTLAGRAISAVAQPAENAVQNKLGQFLVNPAEAQAAAGRLSASNARMVPLSEISRRALPIGAVGGSSAYRSQQQ